MKRTFALIIVLCSMVILTGCSKTEIFPPAIVDANTGERVFLPNISEWKYFKFKALNNDYKDLGITRGETREKTRTITKASGEKEQVTYTVNTLITSKHTDDPYMLVGMNALNCEACDRQAAYFKKWHDEVEYLRQTIEEKQPNQGFEKVRFVPMAIYLNAAARIGVPEAEANFDEKLYALSQRVWFQELSDQNVDVYDNVVIQSCVGGVCRILTPLWETNAPQSGTVICVNKNAIKESVVVIDPLDRPKWANAQTEEELDQLQREVFQKIVEECMDLHPILFDATVESWAEEIQAHRLHKLNNKIKFYKGKKLR